MIPSAAPTRATVLSAATAVPDIVVTSEQVKEYFPKVFNLDARTLSVMLNVVDNARVRKRHVLFPPEYTIEPRPLEQTSDEYRTHAIRLGKQAAACALAQAGLEARDIDLIITVSCTGIMIPSLDAHLVNEMGFRREVIRLPITELGCAAGAAALARAHDHIRAYPEANVLVVAVELPSLTFQRHDASPAQLISCVLFGDGAAAAVLTGRRARGLRILETQTYLIPDSTGAMGFDLRSSGFHIVLSKNVPEMIRELISGIAGRFLARHGLSRPDLRFFLLHPGGQKLLAYIEEELGLDGKDTCLSWHVLSEYGNLSSATVLFILKEFLAQPPPEPGALGLLAAFGPGFSADMALLEWN
ncbi:MAG: type III polyketide synthase [Bryobacteraceae bacterium]